MTKYKSKDAVCRDCGKTATHRHIPNSYRVPIYFLCDNCEAIASEKYKSMQAGVRRPPHKGIVINDTI